MSKKKTQPTVDIIVKIPMKARLAAFVVYMLNMENKDQVIDSNSNKAIPARLREVFYPKHIFKDEMKGKQIQLQQLDSYINFRLGAEMSRLGRVLITPQNINKFNHFVNAYFLDHVSKLIQAEREAAADEKREPRSSRKIIEAFLDRLGIYDYTYWQSIRRAVDRHMNAHKHENISSKEKEDISC